jgi:hypothetical protein
MNYPRLIPQDVRYFLVGSPRLPIAGDMEALIGGCSSVDIMSKLMIVYVYQPQDHSQSLVFYSKRNLNTLKQFLEETMTPEMEANLSEDELAILNSLLEGDTPEVSILKTRSALQAIGWTNATQIDVLQEDGSMKQEPVIRLDKLGADPWMAERLANTFQTLELDPQDFICAKLVDLICHDSLKIMNLQLSDIERAVYLETITEWRTQWIDMLSAAREDLITVEQMNDVLQDENMIGITTLETVTATLSNISVEPIGQSLKMRVWLYEDWCKVAAYQLLNIDEILWIK